MGGDVSTVASSALHNLKECKMVIVVVFDWVCMAVQQDLLRLSPEAQNGTTVAAEKAGRRQPSSQRWTVLEVDFRPVHGAHGAAVAGGAVGPTTISCSRGEQWPTTAGESV